MMAVIFTLITAIPGLTGEFLKWQTQKMNVSLEGFKTASGVDLAAYQSWLNATIEINRMKLAANSWWGAKLIILTAGWPCAIHLAAIMLDSFPWWVPFAMTEAHVIGSWGVPKPPAPYDDYQAKIVLSFFIIMPTMALTSAVSQWLNRK